MSVDIIELEIKITGRVQGINFRNTIKSYCVPRGIKGYVMNKEDGSVFIISQGEEEKTYGFVEWIKSKVEHTTDIRGGWIYDSRGTSILSYAKSDSMTLAQFLYQEKNCIHLSRKFKVVKEFYGRVAELV